MRHFSEQIKEVYLVSLLGLLGLAYSNLGLAAEPTSPPALPAWKNATVPDSWKQASDGPSVYLWYRCRVQIPAEWKETKVTLFVEAVDDAREFYWQGKRVGHLGNVAPVYKSGLGQSQRLEIPAEALSPGQENLLAIRIHSEHARSGFNVAPPVLFAGTKAIRLAGQWETSAGDNPNWAKPDDQYPVKSPPFSTLAAAEEVENSLRKLASDEGPLSPAESLARMKTADDLEVQLVLSEPEIAQPLSLKWDSRGRLWVVQFIQYPMPAGLTPISRDKFLRTVYDRLPAAPPNHFPGADKITIHEDTDGDGKLDKHKTFLEGLSLVSSLAFGDGGVWVLNPPFLLFYPDRNHDDIPDGDPEVHLSGFGIEDSHSISNNLRWGPDGWLYASQGSTVTGNIRRPGIDKTAQHSLGQLIWRYHPPTKRYEVFAEGGGNAFGVEINAQGRIFSGHNGGNTRGFHYVQGGYSAKGFGKHGSLSNPFTFGYFEAMAHHDVPRFSHCFVIYQGGALPPQYAGQMFAVGPLQGHVVLSEVSPDRSSFKTKDIGLALQTNDSWFRPVDIQPGPDGAIYVADMYEQRIDHASHYQGRIHKSSGRIYRLVGKGSKPVTGQPALDQLPSAQLLSNLDSPNRWVRETTRVVLARQSEETKVTLATQITSSLPSTKGQLALEQLWALEAISPPNDREARLLPLLTHAEPAVREWAVRLVCDQDAISPTFAAELAKLAATEPEVHVRSQLASSARRLPVAQSLPILRALAQRDEDAADIHLPLLIWWGIEKHAEKQRGEVLKLFADKAFWDHPLVAQHLTERLMRRYASTGLRQDLLSCAKLLELAPSPDHASRLVQGLETAYQGRVVTGLPAELSAALAKAGGTSPILKLRQGDPQAVADALKTLADETADATKRQQLAEIIGSIHPASAAPVLLEVVRRSRNDALRSSALSALQSYADPQLGAEVIALYGSFPDDLRNVAQNLLVSRAVWAEPMLLAVDEGRIEARTIADATVRRLLLYDFPQLKERITKHWGNLAGPDPATLRAEVERLLEVARAGTGSPYEGKKLFATTCGKCHMLFEQGGNIGPNLTAYKRDDLRGMLLNVVNPSAEIREGFENYLLVTTDGRTLNGFITEQDAQVVVLRGIDGQSLTVPRDEIDQLRAIPRSLMPEGLLKEVSPQQICDLLAYLRSTQPLP